MSLTKYRSLTVLVVAALVLMPLISFQDGTRITPQLEVEKHKQSNSGHVHIEDVPYQWQEMNGFCYWASLSMAMRYAGIPLDLHGMFAATGIGFSSVYVMVDDTLVFGSGSNFQQQRKLVTLSEIFNITHTMFMDNSTPLGSSNYESFCDFGIHVENIDGWHEAVGTLKNVLSTGSPVVLWVDPYYLPIRDCDILRTTGSPQDPDSPLVGHAILAVGFNDTKHTVYIQDPGAGAFGPEFGYPQDGRWAYELNYSALHDAWYTFGYTSVVIDEFTSSIDSYEREFGQFIVDRLLGKWESYVSDLEGMYFVNLGEQAYRGIGLDFNLEGLKAFFSQFESDNILISKLLQVGYKIEQEMTLQYLSYRTALNSLLNLLPNLNLDQFMEVTERALPHMSSLSANGSMAEFDYFSTSDSLLMNTFVGIAEDIQDGVSLNESISAYTANIEEISEHFLAIAGIWKEAAGILQTLIQEPLVLLIQTGILTSAMVALVAVVYLRRRSK